MKTKDRVELAHWVAKSAKAEGASNAAVNISNSRAVEIEFRDSQLDKVQESTQNSLSLSVYADNKFSSHSTNDLRRESLGKFIADAVAMTKYLSEDLFRKLPDPKYYRGLTNTDLDLIDHGYDGVKADQRVKIAKEIQELTIAQSDKIISSTAYYSDDTSEAIKVHSNGFEGVKQTTAFSVGVEATIDDGKGGRPSDWDFATIRHLTDRPDSEKLAKSAVTRVLEKLGQSKAESGTYDMLVLNRAAGKPIYALYGPMTGRALQQKRSYLDGMIGKTIGSELLTITDDPFIKRGLGSRHYDGEGIVTRKRTIIEKGILKEYLIDTYYARKLGVDPTGGSVSNVTLGKGTRSLEAMIKDITKGILVTSFIGGNSNGTTGDYSWGLSGMLIENGKIVRPINEMNISGNLAELWGSLVELGNDPYMYSSFQLPSLYFKDISFSGI